MKTLRAIINLFVGILMLPIVMVIHFLIAIVVSIITTGYNVENRKPGNWVLTWEEYKQAKASDESV